MQQATSLNRMYAWYLSYSLPNIHYKSKFEIFNIPTGDTSTRPVWTSKDKKINEKKKKKKNMNAIRGTEAKVKAYHTVAEFLVNHFVEHPFPLVRKLTFLWR